MAFHSLVPIIETVAEDSARIAVQFDGAVATTRSVRLSDTVQSFIEDEDLRFEAALVLAFAAYQRNGGDLAAANAELSAAPVMLEDHPEESEL